MPRQYNKTSDYWTRIKPRQPKPSPVSAHLDIPPGTSANAVMEARNVFDASLAARAASAPVPSAPIHLPASQPLEVFAADWAGHKEAIAACGGVGTGTSTRDQWAGSIVLNNLYPNISAGIMPFSAEGGYYTMSIPINLATLAYFNIPLVRNTINLLQDFSISPLHIKSSNKTVKSFFTRWFEAVQLNDFMSQWFLEYYRSGNIFIYAFNGRIAEDKFAKMKTAFAEAKSPEMPIRYTILDPKQIYLQVGPSWNQTYVRMLSTYEIQRLRNPQTPEDKQMLRDFPPDIQKQIKNYASTPWVYTPLDTSRFYYNFYRKQPYEPLAVPMIWPLINRLEYKLMLEKMDMSLVQTMEQVFLLVTAGQLPDNTKGVPATNPKALERLQQMFQTQTIGRVLVGDHTTQAKWVIPDLKELLGKGKYEQVDKDIRDGLGYAFFGEDKFANAAIKAKLFIENLREGRRMFLDNFLRPEIKKICQNLGFKNVPVVEFEEVDVQDQSAIQRIYLQMAQLGLLTDTELNDALKTGLLPDKESSLINQEAYKKERAKDLYKPLMGVKDDQQGRPSGGGGADPKSKKTSPIGTRAYAIDPKKLADTVVAMTGLEDTLKNVFKQNGAKKLNKAQETFISAAVKAIAVNEPRDKWTEVAASYVQEPKGMPSEITTKIADIATEFGVDAWQAVAILNSLVENVE